MDANQLRAIKKRYEAHISRREHSSTLRAGQMQLGEDIVAWGKEPDEKTGEAHTRGYFVRPTGTGKTVSLIDFIMGINSGPRNGELLWDKRVLVLTPTNVLNQQFAAELGIEKYRDPEKKYAFNIPEDKIGLYDASENNKKREAALNKHIVVMTYDSFVKAVSEDRLNVSDFAATLLDEVHTKPRGDNTREFIRRHVFNEDESGHKHGEAPTFALGATATHLYKSGQTIGDYLFGGDIPIHQTRINDAVASGEISGYRNVIVETSYNDQARFAGDEELSANARKAILKQEARDEAAVRILKQGHDPITRKPYREMKSVWYCNDVDHAHRLAARINNALGTPDKPDGTPAEDAYARAVSGKTNKSELYAVVVKHKQKGSDLKAVTNADLLIHGFDNELAELCFMTHPSQSPIEVLQMAGRVLRKHKLKPHATVFSFPDPDKNSIIFGELAGSYHSLDGNHEFPATAGMDKNTSPPVETPWPQDLSDLNAHYLTRDIEKFAERRRVAQATSKKPSDLLTTREMAAVLGTNQEILEHYLYKPLQGLYDQRHARQQELDIRDATSRDEVHINGQRFAIGSATHPGMGYFQTGANEVSFCLNKEAANACRFALFGRLPESKKYFYSKATAARIVGASNYAMDGMSHAIEDAYHSRNNYQRTLEVDYQANGDSHHAKFKLNQDVVFCIDQNRPKLFFTAEGLRQLYQLAHGVSEEKAQSWWQSHPDRLPEVKTPEWLNKDEAMNRLGIHGRSTSYPAFDKVWKSLPANKASGTKVDEGQIRVHTASKRNEIAPSQRKELCVDGDSLDWIREQMAQQDVGSGGFASKAAKDKDKRSGRA